jgi:RNA polymerase sigma factor (sigma-70 family)
MPREIAYNWLDRTAAGLSAEEAMFVVRLQANEDAAYDELVRTYSASMFHIAYRMLGDNAEASDIVQEIFLKVFRNIGGFKGEAALKTWIFKIAFSEILNRLRWWKRRHRSSTVSLRRSAERQAEPVRAQASASSTPTPEQQLQSKRQRPRSTSSRGDFRGSIDRSSCSATLKDSPTTKSPTF